MDLGPLLRTDSYDAFLLNPQDIGGRRLVEDGHRGASPEGSWPPFNTKESCQVGCLNARTMYVTGRSSLVAQEIKRYNLELAGLSETRWLGCGKVRIDVLFIYSGKEQGEHERGVAIALSKKAEKMLEHYEYIDERIVTCRLRGKYANITVIQVYASTEESGEDEKDEFYEKLTGVIQRVRRHDMLLLMGDFNAKVGRKYDGFQGTTGKFGIGARNDDGRRLLELCSASGLSITNTFQP
ncbi:craniofacial development protein 2-like [Macrobrachium nipponense]|uniref:craniofacial development protein 2-like n=1 Tax=Macrobrachium nipponense TaxID=159736 RepID=UPI0030C84CCC